MVITKREDVTKQGLCKMLLLALIQFFWVGGGRTVGAYLSLSGRAVGAYSRLGAYYLFRPLGWALIREVGANSRLGAYSNKYGICSYMYFRSLVLMTNIVAVRREDATATAR